jgi:hypothetical protein
MTTQGPPKVSSWRLALALASVLWIACRSAPRSGGTGPVDEPGPNPPAMASSLRPAALSERELGPEPDPLRELSPPDAPSQRIAFSHGRLAWLASDELRVWSLDDLSLVTRFRARGARNVVALTGGGFLIAPDDHLLRLSNAERRPELLPRAPRIGPTTIIPSRIESEQFWLYYAGISELPRFDLGGPPRIASLPMLDWTELFEFDQRALLGLGDGSFVYTTAEGLRRIDVEGRRERLPQPELGGRVWALARDERLDRVWAATERHLYLLHVREQASVLRRFELGLHPVALAAEEGTAAILRVESLAPAVRAAVDVYVDGASPPRIVHLAAEGASAGEAAAAAPRFQPELALSVKDGLVAASGIGLQLHDYRRGVRVPLQETDAQKLAPAAP